jgi:ribonuclease T1
VKWNRQTVIGVVIAFATVAFVSLMLALGDEPRTITIGGDAPSSTVATGSTSEDVESADIETADIETGDTDPESGLPWVREDELPVFAQGTLALIDQGGPFPCGKDGSTFQNREGLLPDQERGYYAEYTVLSTSSCDGPRGAERIVTGSGGEFYWTSDHYESFERILRRAS